MQVESLRKKDDRDYKALRKLIKIRLEKSVPTIMFEDAASNQPQRIVSKNMTKLLLYIAEKAEKGDVKCSMVKADKSSTTLKEAAGILRKETLKFISENTVDFDANIEAFSTDTPQLLTQFLKNLLAGDNLMPEHMDSHVSQLAATITSSITYNIKTDRQIGYKPETESIVPRHSYTPKHHIGLALAIRESDRNNQVLNLLSAPNYGLSITLVQCQRLETRIANSVIENMARNGNVYIPPNLVKDVIPFFHLDNVDWNEDRPDGKGTSHLLQLTICQKKLHDHQSLQLQLDHRTTSLMLKPNKFDRVGLM